MALYPYASSSKAPPRTGMTEFEILKASHKFLREEDEKAVSWDEQLAAKYYDSLYREFAICDLKHYKSGNFALRWRTENEVLSGAGETTCGNSRCKHHTPRHPDTAKPSLTTLELPFVYEEHGETKSALVKVVLCQRCLDKLMWKRRKEKEASAEQAAPPPLAAAATESESRDLQNSVDLSVTESVEKGSRERRSRVSDDKQTLDRRRRTSRSRSPRRHAEVDEYSRRRPSVQRRRP